MEYMTGNNKVTIPLSIVIPTYFEEKLLPRLLQSISEQSVAPVEVIVSDGFSTDRTREIAKSFNATVIDGGKVAEGRNNGATVAKGDLVLFVDADTFFPHKTTLERAYTSFISKRADIASVTYSVDVPMSFSTRGIVPHIVLLWINFLKQIQRLLRVIIITELGIFVLVKKSVFEAVNGFDEKRLIGEDKQFFIDAIKKGYAYRILPIRVVTSSRRYEGVRKVIKMTIGTTGAAILGFFGHGVESPARQKFWEMYGELGGKSNTVNTQTSSDE